MATKVRFFAAPEGCGEDAVAARRRMWRPRIARRPDSGSQD
jgi:hypothetical protein